MFDSDDRFIKIRVYFGTPSSKVTMDYGFCIRASGSFAWVHVLEWPENEVDLYCFRLQDSPGRSHSTDDDIFFTGTYDRPFSSMTALTDDDGQTNSGMTETDEMTTSASEARLFDSSRRIRSLAFTKTLNDSRLNCTCPRRT
jgi:hypothetical protein